jgi:hypothetical protein
MTPMHIGEVPLIYDEIGPLHEIEIALIEVDHDIREARRKLDHWGEMIEVGWSYGVPA